MKTLYTEKEIQNRIQELANEISRDYKGKDLLLLGVLKGCYIFLSDLSRSLKIPVTIDFIQAKSYAGKESTGTVQLLKEPSDELIRNKHVLLVEDIIDTGITMNYIIDYILKLKPASLEIATLLNKNRKANVAYNIKYSGFAIEDVFVIGYGMDHNEEYRNCREILVME